tara:strand:+ start:1147 stop:3117 length:1971 start_codon:yes stop_codon:yes gene_type:complete
MDRSGLEKKNLGNMPAAQAAARSGSVDIGKDNLIQTKTHQPLISQSALKQNQPRTTGKQAKQLLAINRSVVADNKSSSSRLIQSKVNPSVRALSKSATNSSNQSVDTLNHNTQLKKGNGFSVVQKEPDPQKSDPYGYEKSQVMSEEQGGVASDLATASAAGSSALGGYKGVRKEIGEGPGATEGAVANGVSSAISFMAIPDMWSKFKKADTGYEQFSLALGGAETAGKAVGAGAEIASASSGGSDKTAADTALISGYTSNVIGLVKNCWDSGMAVKKRYDEYHKTKEKIELAEKAAALKTALELANGALGVVKSYHDSSGTKLAGLDTAIPVISIVTATMSLVERCLYLAKQDTLHFDEDAAESQTQSILSEIPNENKDAAKTILESDEFRNAVIAAAGFEQLKRDNPEVFHKFEESLTNPTLKENLKRNFPQNYERIDKVYNETKKSPEDVGKHAKELSELGMSPETWQRIVGDQTLINHLEEIKGKRKVNAKIGIFTDLVNIGADIATLSGAGAAVGASMKAGAAAMDSGRKSGNLLKSAARSSGANEFAAGAESKRMFNRAALTDHTDILKGKKAKEEHYFSSASMILDDIAKHDKGIKGRDRKQNKASYKWAEAKVLGTGASVAMIKAMLNDKKNTGNHIVKHMMDKLKVRK